MMASLIEMPKLPNFCPKKTSTIYYDSKDKFFLVTS